MGASYREAAAARRLAMDLLLWTGDAYRDYCLEGSAVSAVVALSDWAAPLWAGLTGPKDAGGAAAMVDSLGCSGLLRAGGAATTAVDTCGQTQWDAPNAWPPLQLMLVEGLDRLQGPTALKARPLADSLARTWLDSCFDAWQKSGYMYEKYNANISGEGGGGGEYVPQVGFGWSNGVVLALLVRE